MIKNNQYVVDRLYTDIVTTDVIDKDETIIIYNNSSSGGLIQTVYGYAELDAVYDDANYTETFNAYTINRLHSRVSLVESGSAMSITTIGTGNAVTSLTKSGTVITVNLGNSFSLSGHTHTFNALTDKPTTLSGYGIVDAANLVHTHNYAGSSSAGGKANSVANQLTFSGHSSLSYDGSTAVTIPIPTDTSDLTNGAGYITANDVVIGNAATATKLATARTLWGQSFDGSANVTGTLSSVININMVGTLTIGSAQLIYDATSNTLRVQKSDGTAIGFYSTGEVASYGVGSAGGTSYINAALNILTTNDDAAGINLLKITNNGSDVLKYTRKYNGYDTYDLILGSWSSIQASNRLDFYANQIFFNGNNTYYQSSLNVNRTGDASSTSTQKNSYPLVFQTSIWNGSSQDRIYHSIKATASTTINGSTRLSFIANTDEVGQNGTEILEINSTGIKINGTIVSTGTGTFTGGSFSSLRSLKTVHDDWTGSALLEISKFKVRDFNYNGRLNYDRTLGLIVDEIPESIGDYILMGKNRDSVNLYSLHALSILAHQEEKIRIEQLEQEILELKQKINQLEIIK